MSSCVKLLKQFFKGVETRTHKLECFPNNAFQCVTFVAAHVYLMCQMEMLRETLVEVEQLLELFLKLSDFLPFPQNFQVSLLMQNVLLHLLLSCLYADRNTPSKDKKKKTQLKTDSKRKK